jgi:uncharacterized protein YfaA (DUF2138 family)
MKLQVKIVDSFVVPGGKAVLLCDEAGESLPLQVEAVLRNGVDRAEITVTFAIDGNKVSIV